MNEAVVSSEALAQENLTAGQILRKARQARGLHIAALANSIKVLPRKLELLEADRYDELLDATFARALAQTVCRSLKIDPAPVLALLPKASGMQLEKSESSLNAPFRERSGRPGRHDSEARGSLPPLQVWLPPLLILGAVAVYFAPAGFYSWPAFRSVLSIDTSVSPTLPKTESVASAVLELPTVSRAGDAASAAIASQPSVPMPFASSPDVASAPSLLALQVNKDSWVEVQDGTGKPLLARLVLAQELVALNGDLPMRLKIGNAASTTVRFRGELVDLLPFTRDNVARFELK